MSTELAIIEKTGIFRNKDLSVTSFYGGNETGQMIQVTQGCGTAISPNDPGFIHLSFSDSYKLAIELLKFVKSESGRKAKELEVQISKDIELLELIEVPVNLLKMFGG